MFTIATLDLDHKVFLVYIVAFNISSEFNKKYLFQRAQIAYLKVDEAFTEVSSKYIKFADVFLLKSVAKLPKHMDINNYAINLVDDSQLSYGPIYRFDPIDLEILKAYIKNNLANSFIKPSKFLVGGSILYD